MREEWRDKYDPDGTLSVEDLRQKARDEFTDQARHGHTAHMHGTPNTHTTLTPTPTRILTLARFA